MRQRFVFDPASGLMLPRRAEPRLGKRLCSLFTAGPGFFSAPAAPPPPSSSTWTATGASPSFATWGALSNSNRTFGTAGTAGHALAVKGTTLQTSGKVYYECLMGGGAGGSPARWFCGLILSTETLVDSVGTQANNVYYRANQAILWNANSHGFNSGFPYGSGDLVGVAYDFSAGQVDFYLNGSFVGSATGWSNSTVAQYCGTDNGDTDTSQTITMNSSAAQLVHTPPSGFTAWG